MFHRQDACLNRMLFKLKIAEESYNDERRVKVSVYRMEPMDYVKECQVRSRQAHGGDMRENQQGLDQQIATDIMR